MNAYAPQNASEAQSHEPAAQAQPTQSTFDLVVTTATVMAAMLTLASIFTVGYSLMQYIWTDTTPEYMGRVFQSGLVGFLTGLTTLVVVKLAR